MARRTIFFSYVKHNSPQYKKSCCLPIKKKEKLLRNTSPPWNYTFIFIILKYFTLSSIYKMTNALYRLMLSVQKKSQDLRKLNYGCTCHHSTYPYQQKLVLLSLFIIVYVLVSPWLIASQYLGSSAVFKVSLIQHITNKCFWKLRLELF